MVKLGESRSPFQRPSSTGNPHEQFVEHKVLAFLFLSPKKPGIESTMYMTQEPFLDQSKVAPQREKNNKTLFGFLSLKTLRLKSTFSLYYGVGEFHSLSTRRKMNCQSELGLANVVCETRRLCRLIIIKIMVILIIIKS